MSSKKCVKARVLLSGYRVVSSLLLSVTVIAVLLATPPASAQQAAVSEPKVFEVVARRFSFEPATIDVVEGDTVRLLVRSADGPHGVEIKAFKVKKAVPRAKPGDSPVTIEFVAAAAGEYPSCVPSIAATGIRT